MISLISIIDSLLEVMLILVSGDAIVPEADPFPCLTESILIYTGLKKELIMGIAENLKKGTSELLILYLLNDKDMYGYQIAQELKNKSGDEFVLPEGSLYPTLYRLIEKGVVSDRMEIVGKRLRKYYHLEPKGIEYLNSIAEEYRKINEGIQKVLDSLQAQNEAKAE